jgi:hypothetical protein
MLIYGHIPSECAFKNQLFKELDKRIDIAVFRRYKTKNMLEMNMPFV